MGRKTDPFQNENTSKKFKSNIYNSSNLCTLKETFYMQNWMSQL